MLSAAIVPASPPNAGDGGGPSTCCCRAFARGSVKRSPGWLAARAGLPAVETDPACRPLRPRHARRRIGERRFVHPSHFDFRNGNPKLTSHRIITMTRCAFLGAFVAGCPVFFLLLPAALIGWNSNLRHLHTGYVRVASHVDDASDDFGGDGRVSHQSLSNATYRCGNWVAHRFSAARRFNLDAAACHADGCPVVSKLLAVVHTRWRLGLVVHGGLELEPAAQHAADWRRRDAGGLTRVARALFRLRFLRSSSYRSGSALGRPRTAVALAAVPAVLGSCTTHWLHSRV